jgi:uncharacterized phiE125 gp8 family phage protein
MAVVLITSPPAVEPVTLAEILSACRQTAGVDDTRLLALALAARRRIEDALGLCLIATGVTERRDAFAPVDARGGLTLARGPLLSVDAVATANSLMAFQTVDPSYYAPLIGSWPAQIGPSGLSFIQPTARGNGLRIDYHAGFGATPDLVPASLKEAVLALTASAYDRETEEPPLSVAEPWLSAWRKARL